MARGGARAGAGRPAGSTSATELRKNRTMRATEEEWELIKLFAKRLKKDKERAIELLEQW